MRLVEIEFRGRRRTVYANPEEYPLTPDLPVIVQADRGIDLGHVNLAHDRWVEFNRNGIEEGRELESVLRLATSEDLFKLQENAQLELDARSFFREEIHRLTLEMKLVDVEWQLDRRKLTFYFTADGRVDFRELVKSLAQKFHTRIDLRQIGARDESKRLGGIGICGRELCCSSWIREFKPVTTSMMKDQHLILNPQKNTGPCGKLRCCLRFEVEQYKDLSKLFPRVGLEVVGPRGPGHITRFSYNWEHVGIEWVDGAKYSYGLEHLLECSDWNPEDAAKIMLLTFHSDPSQEQQRKQEKEGELVARGEPRDNGEPRVSIRTVPKKVNGDAELCEVCGRDKREGDHHHAPAGEAHLPGPADFPRHDSEVSLQESVPGKRRSRRGGSKRRGRGRGRPVPGPGPGEKTPPQGEPEPQHKPARDSRAKNTTRSAESPAGQPRRDNAAPTDGKKSGRRRSRRGGGRNHPSGQDSDGAKDKNKSASSAREPGVRPASGASGDQRPSSHPADGDRQARPPRTRGRNRKR